MKKGFLIGIVFVLCLGAVAQMPQRRYWQNEVPRLSQQWLNAYGYTSDSVLAYGLAKHEQDVRRLQMQLLTLEGRVKALEPKADPNEPK